jgi:hypothetical protein
VPRALGAAGVVVGGGGGGILILRMLLGAGIIIIIIILRARRGSSRRPDDEPSDLASTTRPPAPDAANKGRKRRAARSTMAFREESGEALQGNPKGGFEANREGKQWFDLCAVLFLCWTFFACRIDSRAACTRVGHPERAGPSRRACLGA